jgi:hypothetical protein
MFTWNIVVLWSRHFRSYSDRIARATCSYLYAASHLGPGVSKPPMMLPFPSRVPTTPAEAPNQVANKMKNLRRALLAGPITSRLACRQMGYVSIPSWSRVMLPTRRFCLKKKRKEKKREETQRKEMAMIQRLPCFAP